jgi:hypothetical protein
MNRTLRQIIGVYELLTGGFGGLWLAYSILLAGGGSLAGLVFFALYVLTGLAGWWLLKGRAGGVRLSIVAQAMQVPYISLSSLMFYFTAGAALWLRIGGEGLWLDSEFGTRFNFSLLSGFGPGRQTFPLVLGVNLVPLAVLVYLVYAGRGKTRKRR